MVSLNNGAAAALGINEVMRTVAQRIRGHIQDRTRGRGGPDGDGVLPVLKADMLPSLLIEPRLFNLVESGVC